MDCFAFYPGSTNIFFHIEYVTVFSKSSDNENENDYSASASMTQTSRNNRAKCVI